MATAMMKLYTALRAANVPEDKAAAAAEEAASFDTALAGLKSGQRLHGWILTFNTGMLVAIMAKLFLGH
jgi:hypothetical protein